MLLYFVKQFCGFHHINGLGFRVYGLQPFHIFGLLLLGSHYAFDSSVFFFPFIKKTSVLLYFCQETLWFP